MFFGLLEGLLRVLEVDSSCDLSLSPSLAAQFHELDVVQPRIGEGGPLLATGAVVYEGELRGEFEKVMGFLEGKSKTYE